MEEPNTGVDSNTIASEPAGVRIKALCNGQFSQGPDFSCWSENLRNGIIGGYLEKTQRDAHPKGPQLP